MTSRDYRYLRQVELIRFAVAKFGKAHWKKKLADVLGVHANEMGRWLLEDVGGRIQAKVEEWAEQIGFRSHYAEPLAQFRPHVVMLRGILQQAQMRRAALAETDLKERVNGGALPLSPGELDQAFAALGLDLIPGG